MQKNRLRIGARNFVHDRVTYIFGVLVIAYREFGFRRAQAHVCLKMPFPTRSGIYSAFFDNSIASLEKEAHSFTCFDWDSSSSPSPMLGLPNPVQWSLLDISTTLLILWTLQLFSVPPEYDPGSEYETHLYASRSDEY